MANILLLDESEVACRALRGILARSGHRLATAATVDEAWALLRKVIVVDLVFAEVKLEGESGLALVQRIRSDPLLKRVPVVVYTKINDHQTVAKALGLQVQNYLIKPYHDDSVFEEIAKAGAAPWRNPRLATKAGAGKPDSPPPAELRERRLALADALANVQSAFLAWGEGNSRNEAPAQLTALLEAADAAVVPTVNAYLQALRADAEKGEWSGFLTAAQDLECARRIIECHLDPCRVPEEFLSGADADLANHAQERAFWTGHAVTEGAPLLLPEEVQKKLDGLAGCPLLDTVSASFQMTANGQGTNLKQLMDLVRRDPGLSAQVLMAANQLEADETSFVEDPVAAINLLGELRLAALAKTLPTIQERHLNYPPLTWVHYWMFQMGVAVISEHICNELEFHGLTPHAYTAGLLHDLGKLLLIGLFPFGFEAMIQDARDRAVSLEVAERRFIGCTTAELGEYFGRKRHLPPMYCNVIRWVEQPASAPEYADLVGVVALARHVCLHNHLGHCGDGTKRATLPLEETPAWTQLSHRVFPSFNLRRFETRAHAFCLELRKTLLGRQKQVGLVA